MAKKESKKKKKTSKKSKKKVEKKKKKQVKAKEPAVEVEEKPKIAKEKESKYIEAVGRRKTAVARVRIWPKDPQKEFLVNGKPYQEYFPSFDLQYIVKEALKKVDCLDKFKISVLVRGGGLHGQAEAIRHGIARALVLLEPEFRKKLKRAGFLTRDPRMRERKKFGLKRARRAPQWQKR